MFKLHHVDIWISDIEESIRFYSLLGFNKVKEIDNKEKNKKIILMKNDSIILEMKYHYNNNCKHSDAICGDNKIFGLSVNDINEAKNFIEKNKLTNQEIRIEEGILGEAYFIIKDPNGISIEFIEEN